MTLMGNTTGEPDTGELMVGGYRLLSPIGEGGMGVVHLAQGADGRRVALKVLRPQAIGDSDARDRLAREVATLQRVRSPHVAEILDAEPHADVPFVVTRYVPGLPLHRHVEEEGTLAEADLRWFGGILARAMHDCHAAGVLHRDIKPGNVLMEGRSPVLIDFGLAKVVEDSRLTQTGWLMGTPGYLAPEILYGEDPTPASDVHAWAATVVYAATGRAPYGKGPSMAVLDRVRRGEADLSGVPSSLVPILQAGLSHEPHNRPTVAQILRELDPGLHRPSDSAATSGPPPARPMEAAPTQALPTESRTSQGNLSLGEGYNPHQVTNSQGTLGIGPAMARKIHGARQRLGLLGVGATLVGALALAPWITAMGIGLVVIIMRFLSVTAERHRLRQHYRGRRRWFDVPVSFLSSPGYLVVSLAGSLALLLCAAATVTAVAGALMLVSPTLWLGMSVAATVGVACLWWGPGSTRLRRMTHRATRPWAGESRAGVYVGLIGLMMAAVLIINLASSGPVWSPASQAPWTHGILGQLARLY